MKIYSVVCVVAICGFFAACSGNGENIDEVTNADGEPLTSAAATSPPTIFDVTDDPRATYEQYINEPENKDLFESDEPLDRYLAFVKTLSLAYATPQVDPDFAPLDDYLHPTFRKDFRDNINEFREKDRFRVYLDGAADTYELRLLDPVYKVDDTYLEGQQAFLTNCEVEYTTVIDKEGNIIGDSQDTYGRYGLMVEMRFEDGNWRVFDQQTLLEYAEGLIECDFQEFLEDE